MVVKCTLLCACVNPQPRLVVRPEWSVTKADLQTLYEVDLCL